MTDSTAGTAEGANSPWGWLGLLKWSLAYSDGTTETSHQPMSDEDKEFLEKVMKEGIIDENERMKEILKQVTQGLDDIKAMGPNKDNKYEEKEDEIQDLLQELRDIVEQIDYARAFAAMKGLNFLVGCIAQSELPKPTIRSSCLGVLSTMAANNPPIQKELLELGAIKTLSDLFLQNTTRDENSFRAKIVQALSAMVRSYELSEQVFCGVEQACPLIMEGLQGNDTLRKRTIFFLRALITSDGSSRERVRLFVPAIAYAIDSLVTFDNDDVSAELREMTLAMLCQILEQKHSVNILLDRKQALVSQGVQRVAALRALTGEDREFASMELENWENLLVQLARAVPDSSNNAETLLLTTANPAVEPQ